VPGSDPLIEEHSRALPLRSKRARRQAWRNRINFIEMRDSGLQRVSDRRVAEVEVL
jgi:hypothetical protein